MLKLLIIATLAVSTLVSSTLQAVPVYAATPSPAATATTSTQAADVPDALVPAVNGQSVTRRLTTRARSSWPWYITRAAGMVAAVALVMLLLSGVGLITGATFKFLEPLTAWATHRAIGLVFAVSVTVHILALLFDKFVPFSIMQILVPFSSHYRPVTVGGYKLGSLWVALGIFAFYGVIIVVLTSLFWIDKKQRIWKFFHYLAYLVMVLAFFHALFLGTDLTHGSLRVIWIIAGMAVAIAIVARLRRVGLK